MSAVAGPPSRPVQLQQNQPPLSQWEFTRRKRWADLLITELSEAILLVLSPSRKVLFCNPAVREILGWQDEDLIDTDLTDLVNGLYTTHSIVSHIPADLLARGSQPTTGSVSARNILIPLSIVKSYTFMRVCAVNLSPLLTWPSHHPLQKRSSSRLSAIRISSQEKPNAAAFLWLPSHSQVEIRRCGSS